jgi:hypothetical protein
LIPAGDRLRFRPGQAVTPEEREALRRHKAEVMALLLGLDLPPSSALDPVTVRAVLGLKPDAVALAALEADVRVAIAQYRLEVASGRFGAGVVLVRGRPLADYLNLDTVAWLLGGGRR